MVVSMMIGYARVSTADQNLHLQEDALQKAGCYRIFSDVVSGTKDKRPGLDEALSFLREGDTLVVWKIDRLGRSISHLIQIIEDLRQRGVAFRSLNDAVFDTQSAHGKLLFNFFAVLADYERGVIRERTIAGLASAKARGRKGGRQPVMTPAKLEKAKQLMAKGLKVREAAAAIKVGKTALYEALRKEGKNA
jgi:invertase/recombinase like protein